MSQGQPHPSQQPPSPKTSSSSTLVIVLAVFGVVGLLCLGGGGYFLMKGVRSGRDAARRVMCKDNLHQIGIALHNYHEQHGSFPPAYTTDQNGKPLHSWRVLLLPYLDRPNLYQQIRLDEP